MSRKTAPGDKIGDYLAWPLRFRPVFDDKPRHAAEFANVVCNDGQPLLQSNARYHHIVGTYWSTQSFKMGADLGISIRSEIVKRQRRERGHESMHARQNSGWILAL